MVDEKLTNDEDEYSFPCNIEDRVVFARRGWIVWIGRELWIATVSRGMPLPPDGFGAHPAFSLLDIPEEDPRGGARRSVGGAAWES